MSNRRENIKKSLGITEYPWSSDDEDNPQGTLDLPANRRQIEQRPSNIPTTPGTPEPVLPASPRRNVRTNLERNIFWSMLNTSIRAEPPGPPPRPSPDLPRPSGSSLKTANFPNITDTMTNLQRLLAIKRISRSNKHCLRSTYHYAGHSSRNSASTSAVDNSATRRSLRKKDPVMLSRGGNSRFRVLSSQRDNRDGAAGPWELLVPSDSAPSDDEQENSPRAMTASRTNVFGDEERNESGANPAALDGRNTSPANATEDRISLEASATEDRVDTIVNISEASRSPTDDIVDITEDNQPNESVSKRVETNSAERGHEETDGHNAAVASTSHHGAKRKREGNEDSDLPTVKDFNQSLLSLLECPVCLEWMEPPMTQCRRGHLVCSRCRERLSACPVCRIAFSSVRNRAMESVAEMLHYPCRHGCGRETRLRRRGVHETSCPARRYRCPVPSCSERSPFSLLDLPLHIQTKHLLMLKVGCKHQFSMNINVEKHDNWLVMVDGDLFHLRMDVDTSIKRAILLYVAYIGPKCNANNYTYEVSVIGQHKERNLVYKRVTHSDLESSSVNLRRQDCFHLTLEQAINFLRYKNRHSEQDKVLEFSVEIGKVKEPTLPDDSDS